MPYAMNEKQFEALIELSDDERYKHFISKVADWQEIWGVRTEDGWLIPKTPDNIEYFPLWPHKEYAQRIANKNWPGHTAEELDYTFLISSGFEELANDRIKIAVFPNMQWQCVLADAREVLADLEEEALLYE